MTIGKSWNRWMLGAVAILMLTLGMAAVYPQVSEAATPTEDVAGLRPGRGPQGEQAQFLAEALGITLEELQAAQAEAHTAALQAAVDAGLITQAQADALAERGGGRIPMLGRMTDETAIDHKALLAEALGISVEELETAQDEARAAAIAQAVADGEITQEQADQMAVHAALRPYLQEAMQSARDSAVAQAVADGVISQEEADAFLSNQGFGHFDGGMMHGRGGRGGHWGFEGRGGPQGRGEGSGIFGMFRGMLNGNGLFNNSDS